MEETKPRKRLNSKIEGFKPKKESFQTTTDTDQNQQRRKSLVEQFTELVQTTDQNYQFKKDFPRLNYYTNFQDIKQKFQPLSEANQDLRNLHDYEQDSFYIMRTVHEDDIHKAMKYGVWTSTEKHNHILNEEYLKQKQKGNRVLLFFRVVLRNTLFGVAEIISEYKPYEERSFWWKKDNWLGLFNIKWLYIKNINIDILDKQQDNKMIYELTDCSKLTQENGYLLLEFMKVEPFKFENSLFKYFRVFDEREDFLRNSRHKVDFKFSLKKTKNVQDKNKLLAFNFKPQNQLRKQSLQIVNDQNLQQLKKRRKFSEGHCQLQLHDFKNLKQKRKSSFQQQNSTSSIKLQKGIGLKKMIQQQEIIKEEKLQNNTQQQNEQKKKKKKKRRRKKSSMNTEEQFIYVKKKEQVLDYIKKEQIIKIIYLKNLISKLKSITKFVVKTIINMDTELLEIFEMYSHKKSELNNGSFVKIFKDAKLLDSKFKSIDLDIIFSKIKTKGKQKIKFKEFLEGVQQVAKHKKIDYEVIVQKIISGKGPQYKGTKTLKVDLYDKKSSYTGVYKHTDNSKTDLNDKQEDLQNQQEQNQQNIKQLNDSTTDKKQNKKSIHKKSSRILNSNQKQSSKNLYDSKEKSNKKLNTNRSNQKITKKKSQQQLDNETDKIKRQKKPSIPKFNNKKNKSKQDSQQNSVQKKSKQDLNQKTKTPKKDFKTPTKKSRKNLNDNNKVSQGKLKNQTQTSLQNINDDQSIKQKKEQSQKKETSKKNKTPSNNNLKQNKSIKKEKKTSKKNLQENEDQQKQIQNIQQQNLKTDKNKDDTNQNDSQEESQNNKNKKSNQKQNDKQNSDEKLKQDSQYEKQNIMDHQLKQLVENKNNDNTNQQQQPDILTNPQNKQDKLQQNYIHVDKVNELQQDIKDQQPIQQQEDVQVIQEITKAKMPSNLIPENDEKNKLNSQDQPNQKIESVSLIQQNKQEKIFEKKHQEQDQDIDIDKELQQDLEKDLEDIEVKKEQIQKEDQQTNKQNNSQNKINKKDEQLDEQQQLQRILDVKEFIQDLIEEYILNVDQNELKQTQEVQQDNKESSKNNFIFILNFYIYIFRQQQN